jgi:hypothetical protein
VGAPMLRTSVSLHDAFPNVYMVLTAPALWNVSTPTSIHTYVCCGLNGGFILCGAILDAVLAGPMFCDNSNAEAGLEEGERSLEPYHAGAQDDDLLLFGHCVVGDIS